MPHTPLRKLKNEPLVEPFLVFNFDELDSEDEVPEDRGHERYQLVNSSKVKAIFCLPNVYDFYH